MDALDFFKDVADGYGIFDTHAHYVTVPFPATPWDSDRWVVLRESMVWNHILWFSEMKYEPAVDVCGWSNKPDAEMVYSFKDPDKAMLFKLACGGR
jgi:hypothetical protein